MLGSFTNAIDTLFALQEAVEAARTSDYFGLGTTNRGTFPSINLFEEGDNVILMAEVPGVKKEDIKLQIKEGLITISGERKIVYPENASIHRVERRSRQFNRSIRIQKAIDVEKAKAEYNNGILKVVLPRSEADKPKMININ